jgi:uncharacterized protein (DUF885 family)
MRKIVYLLLASAVAFSCQQNKGQAVTGSLSLSALLDNYYEERLPLFPLEATAIADHRFNDQLPNDLSVAHRAKVRGLYTKYLAQLHLVDTAALSQQEKLSYAIFKRDMEMALAGLQFPEHLMPLNQFWGLPLTFAQLGSGASNQPFKTVKDYDNFLGRIEGFRVLGDTAIANMRRGLTAGIVLPRALAQKVVPQMRALVVADPQQSIFYDPIRHLPRDFSPADQERLTQAYRRAITEKIVPTYKKLQDFMQQQYLPKARASSGISGIPGGDAYYRYLVRYWTTTDKTPEEIFTTGQQEVKRIRAEMEAIRNQVGFQGDLAAFSNTCSKTRASGLSKRTPRS